MPLKKSETKSQPPAAEKEKASAGPAAERTSGVLKASEAAAADQAARTKAEEETSAKTLKESGAKAVEGTEVEPGKYRAKRFKMTDPYTNLTFYPDRETTVAAVTSWFSEQVKAGVLILCAEAPAAEK